MHKEISDLIKRQAAELLDEMVSTRRHIHMNPELSFEEYETAAFVEEKLAAMGIEPRRMAKTGVVALIEGRDPGSKVVGLRADLDALPINETEDGRSYRSTKPNVMHACGHDFHTTALLGAAKILNANKDYFRGTVKLIFQPGEEKLPGGASILIAEGVLDNPKVDVMIGQHVLPLMNSGEAGFRQGLYMASTDELYMTVYGKGGHGAMPHFNVDPVLISAHILVALQQIVSRNANPAMPSVLSFGKVIADGATNVIPASVKLEGTFRTMDEAWRAQAHEKIQKMVSSIAESMGGSADLEIRKGYPFLKNNEELTARCSANAASYLGENAVHELGIWMAAEDFAYYSQELPACFYRIGVRNEDKGIVHSVHHPSFDAEEGALEQSAGLMAYLAITELGN